MQLKLTASNIVNEINKLPKNKIYDYVNPSTTTKIKIDHIDLPEGPITIRRFNPRKGEGPSDANSFTISSQMIWRIANAFVEGHPINFDRVLGASYNTRSILEALMAYTPNFYFCYPGRNEVINESSQIKKGHKHLIWLPNEPHEKGVIEEADTNIVISEGLIQDVTYEALVIPDSLEDAELDLDIQRRHAEIQIALMEIGAQLGYCNWIAKNDRGIEYNKKKLAEYESVLPALSNVKQIAAYSNAIKAAQYIDCIWFQNSRFIPAVMEIEHSTGVNSGLRRMKDLYEIIPSIKTRYVIVASDKDREKVKQKSNKEQFKEINAYYFPYSAVEELYYLCGRRNISGVTQDFLDSFMEPLVIDE
jgi:type II restriction enzyme